MTPQQGSGHFCPRRNFCPSTSKILDLTSFPKVVTIFWNSSSAPQHLNTSHFLPPRPASRPSTFANCGILRCILKHPASNFSFRRISQKGPYPPSQAVVEMERVKMCAVLGAGLKSYTLWSTICLYPLLLLCLTFPCNSRPAKVPCHGPDERLSTRLWLRAKGTTGGRAVSSAPSLSQADPSTCLNGNPKLNLHLWRPTADSSQHNQYGRRYLPNPPNTCRARSMLRITFY